MLHVPLTVQLSDVAMVHVVSAARAASDDTSQQTPLVNGHDTARRVSRQIIIIIRRRRRRRTITTRNYLRRPLPQSPARAYKGIRMHIFIVTST